MRTRLISLPFLLLFVGAVACSEPQALSFASFMNSHERTLPPPPTGIAKGEIQMPTPVAPSAPTPRIMKIGVEATVLLPFLAGNKRASIYVPELTPALKDFFAQNKIHVPTAITRFGIQVHELTNYADLIKIAMKVETDKKASTPRLPMIFVCLDFAQTLGAIKSAQQTGYVTIKGTQSRVSASRQSLDNLLTQFNLASKTGCRQSVNL